MRSSISWDTSWHCLIIWSMSSLSLVSTSFTCWLIATCPCAITFLMSSIVFGDRLLVVVPSWFRSRSWFRSMSSIKLSVFSAFAVLDWIDPFSCPWVYSILFILSEIWFVRSLTFLSLNTTFLASFSLKSSNHFSILFKARNMTFFT